MRGFRFLDPALHELADAAAFYADGSERLSLDLQKEMNRALEHLREFPLSAPPIDAVYRSYKLRCFPFLLVYRVTDTELVIVAVAHGSREMDYWRGRETQ